MIFPAPVANVKSLTHYGEPYDGSTRFFRCTLFSSFVRASYGESCLIHGTDLLAPKVDMLSYLDFKFYLNPPTIPPFPLLF